MTARIETLLPAAREDRFGLVLAALLHTLLLAGLLWKPASLPAPLAEPMSVALAESVGLTSRSPDPSAKESADVAPRLGEPTPLEGASTPIKPIALESSQEAAPTPLQRDKKVALKSRPQPAPEPSPSSVAKPAPAPRPAQRPAPQSLLPPTPMPASPAVAKTAAKPANAQITPPPHREPVPAPAARRSPVATSLPSPTPRKRIGDDFLKGDSAPRSGNPDTRTVATSGGSRLGDKPLNGSGGVQTSETTGTPPAGEFGPAVQSALAGSISRQLKPHWVVPQGAESEKLVTVLSWSFNRDGSLTGQPRVVRQEGVTDANRTQAARHAEQAKRSVQLAAPFNLPPQYYDAWKHVTAFRFDRKLWE